MPSRTLRMAAALSAATLAITTVAACSTKAETSAKDSGGMPTGPGVDGSTINLGLLTDITGPFAAIDKQQNLGVKLYWDAKNAAGGVCDGRKVNLVTRDHGYDPQKAVSLYSDMSQQVLALQITVGSPTTLAVLPKLEQDKVLAVSMGWSPSVKDSESIIIPGTTYDIEMVNAVGYLIEEKKLAKGDKIGYIYLKGDYGEPGLAGATFAAEANGISVVGQQIDPTVSDLAGQVKQMADAGVKALFVSASGRQVSSAAAVADVEGLDVPIVAAAPGFSPESLTTGAGTAMEKNMLVVGSAAPFAGEGAGPEQVRNLYAKSGEKSITPSLWVTLGYAAASVMDQAITQACENKDLSREGLSKAFRQKGSYDTQQTTVPLDFSKPGVSPSTETFILKPSKGAEGGLELVKSGYTGPDTAKYQAR
ncbi:hypothetical protein C1I98_03090 [Spongiactinospora gelatinilytica]|uniref:Leucine-binding protein domain-containing protein n=1 Tax=Spongiactinospora gelatinilytica TaxID=2666298 RepID=A0A2W2H5C6_9ACTN|nr:ABC transporter substrate-binding protein [Spongiactinospora gelatinilytica]PZG55682.1 hypothetical protein C1I98_03090 [Spongiactinospora gelatinilytica]